jgi:hypothetical protein
MYAGLLLRGHDVQGINSYIKARTSKVLPTVNDPLEHGDDNDDSKSCNAVVYQILARCLYQYKRETLTHTASGHRTGWWENE